MSALPALPAGELFLAAEVKTKMVNTAICSWAAGAICGLLTYHFLVLPLKTVPRTTPAVMLQVGQHLCNE